LRNGGQGESPYKKTRPFKPVLTFGGGELRPSVQRGGPIHNKVMRGVSPQTHGEKRKKAMGTGIVLGLEENHRMWWGLKT